MSIESFVESFVKIESALGLRRSAVLAITLWITVKSYFWAAEFAYAAIKTGFNNETALATGAIILAVTGPISYLQKVVFDSYIGSKSIKPTESD